MATFCLIHGNWHDGSCWAPLVERLRSRGHEVLAPDLPFDDATASYEERARPAVTALADAEQPIVVVGHSVGSAEAALVAAERKAARLVYLCPRFGSFAAPSGAPAVFREGFPFPAKDVTRATMSSSHRNGSASLRGSCSRASPLRCRAGTSR